VAGGVAGNLLCGGVVCTGVGAAVGGVIGHEVGKDEGAGESINQAIARDNPRWSVGLVLEIPIGFREGGGERDRLSAEVERAEQRVVALERSLAEDVRARHRELTHGVRRVELAKLGVDASFEQVRVGQIEYENGRSTAFELVRLGADLAAAQERYSSALVGTAKAAAELGRLAPTEDDLRRLEERP
jgi:outer membrane protein TolC